MKNHDRALAIVLRLVACAGVWVGAWAAAWTTGAVAQAGAAASQPGAARSPAEHYTRWPAIDDVAVSPSGRRLALLQFAASGNRVAAVLDLDPIGKPRVVAAFNNADVTRVYWVNDDRLVVDASARGAKIKAGEGGTWAVDHDGDRSRRLISYERVVRDSAATHVASRVLPWPWELHATLDDGSGDVVVSRVVRDALREPVEVELARLDTVTGLRRSLSEGMPDRSFDWLLDGEAQPRLVTTMKAGRLGIHWRAPGEKDWRQIADFAQFGDGGYTPWLVDSDRRVIATSRTGRDTQALFRLDPATGRLDAEPVVAVGGFDMLPAPVVDSRTGRLLGVHFRADRPMSYWFDPAFERLQRSVDAALPAGRFNRLYCRRCESTRFLVVRSISDRQPGEYYLFDRSKGAMELIGAARPWIDEAAQARRTFHRIAARDGLSLPVYVTHPPGVAPGTPAAAVVLVHGGPWVRGADLRWSAQAQFLASRGYRVIEPEFRGSDGYGYKLFRAGWKQWGQAMQDDLVDALQWAAKEKLVDPARACVMGASYGGYAALMAPVSHPGVFRCAVSFAGVTDIDLMFSSQWSDVSDYAKQYGYPALIGDPRADARMLERHSPLKRVAEIKVPVLLGHGGDDQRVPIEHARRFAAAARAAGVSIDVVDYPYEGHGFFDQRNDADWLERVEAFIAGALAPAR